MDWIGSAALAVASARKSGSSGGECGTNERSAAACARGMPKVALLKMAPILPIPEMCLYNAHFGFKMHLVFSDISALACCRL